jgi:hypothetical protein
MVTAMPKKCATVPKKRSERSFSPEDLYPGLTGKLPRSESIAQLAEYTLALYGRLSELASAAAVFEEATDPPGYQTVYPPYNLRPKRPQKPVSDAAPPVVNRRELVQPQETTT